MIKRSSKTCGCCALCCPICLRCVKALWLRLSQHQTQLCCLCSRYCTSTRSTNLQYATVSIPLATGQNVAFAYTQSEWKLTRTQIHTVSPACVSANPCRKTHVSGDCFCSLLPCFIIQPVCVCVCVWVPVFFLSSEFRNCVKVCVQGFSEHVVFIDGV